MAAPEEVNHPAPVEVTPANPPGSGWLGKLARSTLIPLAFAGVGLFVGLLLGLWRGMDAANDAGGAAIGGDLASMASGLAVFAVYGFGGLVAGLVLGVAIVAGMSLKSRAR